MLNPFSLKGKLLNHLITEGFIIRYDVWNIAINNKMTESNAERRMRQICEDIS